jgi:23S rRNA (uracil1939-C5)-methyltransferase
VRATFPVDELAPGGEGRGRVDGRAAYVPFTAPGDVVRADLAAPSGEGAAHGELLEVLSPGPVRVAPPCAHFGPDGDRCGGCEWQHVTSLAQLSAKERALVEAVRRIGKLDPAACGLAPAVPSPAPYEYRCRAKLHLDAGAGRLVFFRRRSHVPVPVARCHLLSPGLEGLRAALGPALAGARLGAREVSLEWSDLEARGAAALRLDAPAGPGVRARGEALLGAVPGLAGIVLLAEGAPPVLLGDPVLRHARDPADPAAGAQRSRPDVFQQANRAANAALVALALDLLRPGGEEVLELFCGAGNFTLPLAARARAVAAIEVQGPALDLARADAADAARRAREGGRPPPEVRFFSGDALAVARALGRDGRRFGAALLDPPREGAKGIGPLLREVGVPRAVYVSCDPATFARDLRACAAAGYAVTALRAVDLFPQTHHVEAVARLELRGG